MALYLGSLSSSLTSRALASANIIGRWEAAGALYRAAIASYVAY